MVSKRCSVSYAGIFFSPLARAFFFAVRLSPFTRILRSQFNAHARLPLISARAFRRDDERRLLLCRRRRRRCRCRRRRCRYRLQYSFARALMPQNDEAQMAKTQKKKSVTTLDRTRRKNQRAQNARFLLLLIAHRQ